MDNPLTLVAKTEIRNAEVLDIVLEGNTLESGIFLLDESFDVLEVLS
jgi:hypothetical protein